MKQAIELIKGEISQISNDLYLMRKDYKTKKESLEKLGKKINEKSEVLAELEDALEKLEK